MKAKPATKLIVMTPDSHTIGRKRSRLLAEDKSIRESAPSPRHYLQVLLRRLWAIVVVAIVLSGSALGFSLFQTPLYEASTKILIGQRGGDDTPSSLSGNVQGLQALAPTMAEAVTTRPVAQAVVEQLGLPKGSVEAVLESLSAEQVPGTTFINVSYRDPDPKRAQLVVDTTGQVFSEQVLKVSPSANAITATVWERAILPESPASPNVVRNTILAFAFGIFLGVGLAFLLEYME